MSAPEKFSKEWYEAKAQACKDLDAKIALGIPHGSKLPGVKIAAPKAPKAPKVPKAPKADK